MEKVFVHPECPFSENTFNLLTEFYETPRLDFYIAHKTDFLKYVEEPLKDILSQVEKQLPDFMKKYLNIKHERCCRDIEIQESEPTRYGLALCFNYIDYGSQLTLLLQNLIDPKDTTLTFGFYAEYECLERLVENYRDYKNNALLLNILKSYKLTNLYGLSVNYRADEGVSDEIFCNDGFNHDPDYSDRTIKLNECIYGLLESILKEIPTYFLEESEEREKILFDNIFIDISLKLEEILGYSAQQLIDKIALTFKELFPLFLMSNFSGNESPLLISQYFSIYEKEFNPVYQLADISKITGFQTTQLTQWIDAINRKSQTIIQGPPGTGKTFIAEKLAKHLIGGGDGFSDIIQFHPAYTYEDFIEGLRPISQNGQLTYSIVPGRFLEFCEKAEAREDTCVLIIDEINRANLSQVFGELMYLLDDRQNTARFITLASGKLFRIPTNVRIIGTMNTADRSIALVDNALRRRFAFIPIYPNYEVLQQYHHREETGFPVDKLTSIIKNVNRAINNKHYQLGISFFLTKTLGKDIQDIWQMEIEPYLEEYFFDNQAKMNDFLWDKIKKKLGY